METNNTYVTGDSDFRWQTILKIFWAYFWRCLLLSLLLAFGIGEVEYLIGIIIGLPMWVIEVVAELVGLALGVIVNIDSLRKVLSKKFKTFETSIIVVKGGPVTRSMMLRLWWAMYWRSILITLLIVVPLVFAFLFFRDMLGIPLSTGVINALLIIVGLMAFAVTVYYFRKLLMRNFNDFRVAITPIQPVNV